jgi:hypothetical protein
MSNHPSQICYSERKGQEKAAPKRIEQAQAEGRAPFPSPFSITYEPGPVIAETPLSVSPKNRPTGTA